jgi:hypothetical protein
MSKVRDISNLSNIIKTDASGNVSFVSGSTTLATLNTSGQLSGSSPVLSSSYALNADLLDGLDSTQFTLTSSFAAQTASFTAYTASQNILNGTYATTGSNTFTSPQTINSNLVVTGSITAQTLVVQTITSSVDFVTGSTRFGSLSSNTHIITGSMYVTGAFYVTTGSVGIGTSSPSYKLHVSNNTNGFITRFTGGTSSDVNIGIFGSTAGAFGSIGTESNHPFNIFTNGTDRMTITSGGNVGIGTSSPNGPLDIVGTLYGGLYTLSLYDSAAVAANIGGGIYFGGNYTGTTKTGWAGILGRKDNATDGQYGGYMAFYTRTHGVAPAERMRITSGGNVLIGGTSDIASGALVVGDNSSTRPLIIRGASGVDGTYSTGIAFYPWNTIEQNLIKTTVSGNAGSSGFQFMVSNGFSSTDVTESFRINRTSCAVIGALSKGSGSFRIKHPLVSKKNTHQLIHSFIEGPQADLIYRGKIRLNAGKATINIDEASTMTEGTFEALCREVQCFTTNETGWDNVRGKVVGNILTIESQNTESTDEISWMVIGERQDEHIMDTEWTDENGKVIVEPLIPEEITTT